MVTLNYRDSRPIYEQIREGLKRLIVTGALAAEERLPSVRTLATQLSINPNTIQRAYAELERDGYCYSVPGKGSFVAASVETGGKRRRELKERLSALAAELKFLGVAEAELIALVRGAAASDGGAATASDGAASTSDGGAVSDGRGKPVAETREEENA